MESLDELTRFLEEITQDHVWGRLLDRGAAWSIMRNNGKLPDDAPDLGRTIETDLAEHGFSVLRAALSLYEQRGPSQLSEKAFENAAKTFEALVRNGDPDDPRRNFYRTIGAASYHLGGYSAVAYSLFSATGENENASPAENALKFLILRNLDALRAQATEWLFHERNSDENLASMLEDEIDDVDDVVASVVTSTIYRAFAYFDLALQSGDEVLVQNARWFLDRAVSLSNNADNVPLWWIRTYP